MKRNLSQLSNNTYDLLVIGGGIYGACITWEAVLRGLSVALVEKDDFGHATSANSLKTIHGGLRYLQHADFKRMRESIRERRTLMRIAPHLVHPLPCLMPTYGHGLKGREAMTAALLLNDLISLDRNQLDDPQKHLPPGQVVSRQECLRLVPDIPKEGLSGGAVWYDAQVYNSERLTLSFVLSAARAGAEVANYTEVTEFLQKDGCVSGVIARDQLTGNDLAIRAKTVINTAGPWVDRVLGLLRSPRSQLSVRLAKAINIITPPLFETPYAVAVSGRNDYRDSDALINKGSRLLFISPWRGRSMTGTTYTAYDKDPNNFQITAEDIQSFLDEINQTYPAAKLTRNDISFVHAALVPISGVDTKTGSVQRAKHYQIRDHRNDGLAGLISVLGVKYTTARDVAEKVVDKVFETWGQKPPPSTSAATRLYGNELNGFDSFLQAEINKNPAGLPQERVRSLILNYGSAYSEVLRYFDRYDGGRDLLPDDLALVRAQVLRGVREEMAQKLADVIFRRTDLGTAAHPGYEIVHFCAQVMGKELGWNQARVQQELKEVNDVYAWCSS